LSQPFYEGMPHGHVVPAPQFRTLKQVGKDPFNVTEWTLSSHVGTYVDAPMHFVPGGKTIDQIPLERFQGQAVVLGTSRRSVEPIRVSDLKGRVTSVKKGDIVLLYTGWGRLYGQAGYSDHPYISDQLVNWLVERSVSMLGIDFMTPDTPFNARPANFQYPVHRTLLAKEVLINPMCSFIGRE
jgi:kynurenine formamidase